MSNEPFEIIKENLELDAAITEAEEE